MSAASSAAHRPELSGRQRQAEAARLFEVVGLGAGMLDRYPHELSGGQRQRVGFAQALAGRARLILADEPVSMLDVSIRIGLLNLMATLRDTTGVSILYITHDIASARYVADRLIVMYAGQILVGPIEYWRIRVPYPAPGLGRARPARAAVGGGRDHFGEPPKVIGQANCRFGSVHAARHRYLLDDPAAGGGRPGPARRTQRWRANRRPANRGPRGRLSCRPVGRGGEGVLMKITVVGGGSTYTPELADGLGRLAPWVTELVLVDPDQTRLAAVGPVSARIMRRRASAVIRWTSDLDDGLDGAAAVLIQLRVGGQAARNRDETWPLDYDCVGQETTGAGGLARRCWTVPWSSTSPSRRAVAPRPARGSSTSPPARSASSPMPLLNAGHR